jgi:hypothetical protein
MLERTEDGRKARKDTRDLKINRDLQGGQHDKDGPIIDQSEEMMACLYS